MHNLYRSLLPLIAAATPALMAGETDWKILFDGESTDAWRGYRTETFPQAGWEVKDGVLSTVSGDARPDIITVESYDNFELHLEWRVAHRGNSGIFFHVSEEPAAIWHHSPEFQILDDEGYGVAPDHFHATGSLYDLLAPELPKPVHPVGEFNSSRLIVNDGHVEHWMNDRKILEYHLESDDFRERVAASKFSDYPEFARVGDGPIGLQHHGGGVDFRDIRIRRLDGDTDR